MGDIWRMYKFKRAMDKVAIAKRNAQRERLGLPPLRPWYEECVVNCLQFAKDTLLQAFCSCCFYDRYRHTRRPTGRTCIGRVCLDGTYENQLLKTFVGFISGIFLTALLFCMLVWHLHLSPEYSAYACAPIGCVLSLGLAFSQNIRCIVLLMLPSLFSSKGRACLLAYAFVMVINGPMVNFNHNIHVMSDSAICGNAMTANVTEEIVEMATAPVKAIIDRVRAVIRALVTFAEKLREAFLKVKRLFAEVVAAIDRAFAWLKDIVDVCNGKMGAPYMKCQKAFHDVVSSCREKLGPLSPLCEIPNVVAGVCQVARVGELFCKITEAIKDFVTSQIQRRVSSAVENVREMFYFNVTLDYHYNLTMHQSRSYQEIRRGIHDEISGRLRPLFRVLTISNVGLVFMMGYVVLGAMLYRRSYLTKDRFDNQYITFAFRDIDARREDLDKEQALPLNWKEQGKYIKPLSLRLVKNERMKLITGGVMFLGSALHAGFYLWCDYGLYWLLNMIRTHGELKAGQGAPSQTKMHVEGTGILADMYRALITSFDPVDQLDFALDTTPCLPNPSRPDFHDYERIGTVLALCLLLLLSEAYGLRLRHIIAGTYFPDRERERAVYLYNRILQRRGGFIKFMRRQLRRRYETQEAIEKISIKSRLAASFPCLARLLKMCGYERKFCLSCGQPGKPEDRENFRHCDNYDCNAIYCTECFTDINNLCTVCMKPVDYGDMSDISEERDSSDDERPGEMKPLTAKDGGSDEDRSDSELSFSYQDRPKDDFYESENDSDDDRADLPKRKPSQVEKVTMEIYKTGDSDVTDADTDDNEGDLDIDEEGAWNITKTSDVTVLIQPSIPNMTRDATTEEPQDQYLSNLSQHRMLAPEVPGNAHPETLAPLIDDFYYEDAPDVLQQPEVGIFPTPGAAPEYMASVESPHYTNYVDSLSPFAQSPSGLAHQTLQDGASMPGGAHGLQEYDPGFGALAQSRSLHDNFPSPIYPMLDEPQVGIRPTGSPNGIPHATDTMTTHYYQDTTF